MYFSIEIDKITYSYLNLYYRSNYDWMLKYSILLTDKILDCKFSDTHSLRLFIVYESGNFQTYDFKMEYQSSLTNNNFRSDNGTVAVMNGAPYTPFESNARSAPANAGDA